MALTGNIATLFEDNEKQKPLFPITKTKAITNDAGENLDNILNNNTTILNNGIAKIENMSSNILIFNTISIPASNFKNANGISNYPWRAEIPLSGITTNHSPDITFSIKSLDLGILAPIAQSYNGGVYIYSSIQPPNAIEIATLIALKQS